MKSIEKKATTVDNAITDALIELGATTEEVDIEVISKGSKGIFGFGVKLAHVRVTVKQIIEDPIEETLNIQQEITTPELAPELKQEEVLTETTQKPDHMHIAKQRAEKFLYEVLEAMGIQAELEVKVLSHKLDINVTGKKMGMIIGKRGETLESLQYLTNIIINKGDQQYVKVMIDAENYRTRREETLKKLAHKLAKKASQTQKPVMLEPMNPSERRIIHSALQNNNFIKTHSEGKEPFRKVIITPNNYKSNKKR